MAVVGFFAFALLGLFSPLGAIIARGELDIASVSQQLAQVARDVRGAVIPASGHTIAWENPAAQAYLDFFAAG